LSGDALPVPGSVVPNRTLESAGFGFFLLIGELLATPFAGFTLQDLDDSILLATRTI